METLVREAFTAAGRARLSVMAAAQRASDYARTLVTPDDPTPPLPGALLAYARELRILDLIVMDRAVAFERANGTSWATISEVLGLDIAMLRERYSEDLDPLDSEDAEAVAADLRAWVATRGPRAAPSGRPGRV